MGFSFSLGPISFGKYDTPSSSGINSYWQMRYFEEALQFRKKDALAAGITPLAEMGVAVNSPASFVGGTEPFKSGGIKGDWKDIRNLLGIQTEKEKQEARLTAAQADLLEAKAEEISSPNKLETDNTGVINQGQSDAQGGQNNASVPLSGQDPSAVYNLREVPAQKTAGISGGTEGFYDDTQLPGGRRKLYPSQSKQESTTEGIHCWEYSLKKVVDRIKYNFARKQFDPLKLASKELVELRNELRSIRDQFLFRPKKGWHYEYDLIWDEWVPVKNSQGMHLFYKDRFKHPYGFELPGKVVKNR